MKIFGEYIKNLGIKYSSEIEKTVSGFLPKNKNALYLDCGCSDGLKTLDRAKIIGTSKIFGIEMVSQNSGPALQSGLKIITSDLNNSWPIDSQSVDCITATETVEHLVDLDNFFSEAKRVLKRGGILIISTENLASLHNIFALICGNQPYTGPYLSKKYSVGNHPVDLFHKQKTKNNMPPHLNVMTFKSLLSLLKSYGFEISGFKGVGYYPFPLIISKILTTFDKVHSSYVVVKAVKP